MSSKNDKSKALLKVLFITEDDPLYVIQFFDVFFQQYPKENIDVIGITVVDAFHEPIWKTAWRMLNFYGPRDFVRLGWRFALAKVKGHSIKKIATQSGIQVIETESVNNSSYVQKIEQLRPDVLISVAAPEVFKKPLLNTPSLKCINIHSGKLPIYRGMMPNFWQLLHGEDFATITIHEMAEELDAGGIIATKEFKFQMPDSLDRIIVGTKQEGARLMIDVLIDFEKYAKEIEPIDMDEAKYFSFPKSKDVQALRAAGHKML